MPDESKAPTVSQGDHRRLGLSLSGGGSRAAAFHVGTLAGLQEIGLLEDIDVASSVSGGSVLAGAWLASRWQGNHFDAFEKKITVELERGFIARSLNLRAVKLLLPSYTRSHLLAETFDDALMHGMTLAQLPVRPLLSINTSVMNTGQVGRFSRDGFSSTGLFPPGQVQQSSNPAIPLPDFPVALAVTASAAFPVGLPPVYLTRGKQIPSGWIDVTLQGHRRIALTDGGVLENLGVQTLLKSRRFGAWDFIISDAGRKEQPWKPGGILNNLRGALMGLISFPILERVTVMMNTKENRQMRAAAFSDLERSWLIEELRGNRSLGIESYLQFQPSLPRRRILFVRLDQTLKALLQDIPRWRLEELASTAGGNLPTAFSPTIESFSALNVDLRPAIDIHSALGGDSRIAELNQIGTHFSAIGRNDLVDLQAHARWQVHALHAIFW